MPIQMFDNKHPGDPFAKSEDFKEEPRPDRCHIHFIHQDGRIYCQPDVSISDIAEREGNETFRGDDRLTLMSAVYILVTWLHADVLLDSF
jgi:hypothetical protein